MESVGGYDEGGDESVESVNFRRGNKQSDIHVSNTTPLVISADRFHIQIIVEGVFGSYIFGGCFVTPIGRWRCSPTCGRRSVPSDRAGGRASTWPSAPVP